MSVIGIDLGTTNTVAAHNGVPVQFGSEESALLPSVVAYPPNGATLVGTPAKRRRAIDARNTVFSAKRVIGRSWLASEVREFRERYPFETLKTSSGQLAFRTRQGDVTPIDVAAEVISMVTHVCAESPDTVRVAVPASFGEPQRKATLAAAARAGLRSAQLVDEPVATAVAYASARSLDAKFAAVYDLGGGTFDLALVDLSSRPVKIVAFGGDPYLGGDDVDTALASWVVNYVLENHRWDLRSEPTVLDRVVLECERAKVRLSFAKQARVALSQVDLASPVAGEVVTLDQALLSELAGHLVRRTFSICDQVLRDAGLKVGDIEHVLLAGGSSQLHMVREGVAKYFQTTPRCELDPHEVVSLGACASVDFWAR